MLEARYQPRGARLRHSKVDRLLGCIFGVHVYNTDMNDTETNNATGYENAPACEMLATHCAACGRPLVDAVSVEANMGPVCREKYGVADGATDEQRAAANVIVARIAREVSGMTDENVLELVAELRALGFVALADRVVARVVGAPKVTITVEGPELVVATPCYDVNGELVADTFRTIDGRFWDRAAKVNRFPLRSKRALWAALRQCFPGVAAEGPKGRFEIVEVAS